MENKYTSWYKMLLVKFGNIQHTDLKIIWLRPNLKLTSLQPKYHNV